MRSLYEGPFGDQPQVWRLSERHVRLPSSHAARFALQDAPGIDSLFVATSSLPALTPEEVADDDDGGEDIETLLSGESHSAWGTARVRGRVRHWDGLCVFTKEYIPAGGRGRWLYRGYVSQGNVLVGRWRDTFTPTSQVGCVRGPLSAEVDVTDDAHSYEGSWVMTRRSPDPSD
jgi:hypothetical protein